MRLGSLRLAPHQKINWPGIFPRKIKRVVLCCAVLYTPRERGHGGPHAGHHHLATPPALHSSRHMALQMMMQSSRFAVDPGPRPRPTAAAHSNTFCLPPPPPSPILTSFLVCACASATCTHTRTRFCNQLRRTFLFLLAFPNSRDHYRAHAHAFRFLPSRESYHTLPSLDHTTCLVPTSCQSTWPSN